MNPSKTVWTGIGLMIFAALSTSLGQLFWKLSDGLWDINLWIGFSLYGLGAVSMTVAFRFGKLSVLHPLMSIGYVFAIVFGFIFLNEVITINILTGTSLILIGVILIGGDQH